MRRCCKATTRAPSPSLSARVLTDRSKLAHLENSAFKVRELIDGAVVRLVWCPTDENAADIFTKSLGTRKFKKFQAFLLGLPQDGEFKALICRMLFM